MAVLNNVPPMKTYFSLAFALLCGCSLPHSEGRITNPNRPANNVGVVVGAGVGHVVGSTAGGVVGFGEGMTAATGSYFSTRGAATRVVRHWRTETTPDGRTINVPDDYLVDKDGRVIRKVSSQ